MKSEVFLGLLIGAIMLGVSFPAIMPAQENSSGEPVMAPSITPPERAPEDFSTEKTESVENERNEREEEVIPILKPLPLSEIPQEEVVHQKIYTLSEIALHKNQEDCWMAIAGNVYNVTAFISRHPGGGPILEGCGVDATILFTQKSGTGHSMNAWDILPTYFIGTLSQ